MFSYVNLVSLALSDSGGDGTATDDTQFNESQISYPICSLLSSSSLSLDGDSINMGGVSDVAGGDSANFRMSASVGCIKRPSGDLSLSLSSDVEAIVGVI